MSNRRLEDVLAELSQFGSTTLKWTWWVGRDPAERNWLCEVHIPGYEKPSGHGFPRFTASAADPIEAADAVLDKAWQWFLGPERDDHRVRYLQGYERRLEMHRQHPHGVTGNAHPGKPDPEISPVKL